MAKIALVETTPSSTDYHRWFDFEFDRYSLSTSKKKNIIKRLSGFKEFIVKLLIANSFMLIFLTYTIQPLEWWLGLGVLKRFSWLAFFILVSVSIYVLILSLLGMKIKELRFQEE